MGLETSCTLLLADGATCAGRAHLDSNALEFRGPGRKLHLPLSALRTPSAVAASAADLRIRHEGTTLTLRLPDAATAAKWAAQIRSPKTLVDKLGFKPDSRVAVLGIADPDFLAQAAARLRSAPLDRLPARPAAPGLDFIVFPADSAAELARLADLKRHLAPTGAIWIVSLKGAAARIKDTDVMRAAKAAGLVDNKVCSFSATHTALKAVIPLAARAKM